MIQTETYERLWVIRTCRDCPDCIYVLMAESPERGLTRKTVCRSAGEFVDIIEDDREPPPEWCPLPKRKCGE